MDLIIQARKFLKRNSRTILTATAVAGSLATAVVAARDTLRANDVIIAYKMEHDGEDIPTIDLVKEAAPCYIPTAMTVGATITAILGSHATASTKIAAVSSAYSVAQEAAHLYRDKVREIVGERKAQEIQDAVAQEHVEKAAKNPDTVVVGDGEVLCLDAFSNQPFTSTMEKIRKAQNDANYTLLSEMFLTLNEFYNKLGLKPIGCGEDLGWSADHQIELSFSSCLTESGRPCLVVSFKNEPTTEFRYLH